MENELLIMQLIANGGDARSHAMGSIGLARKGEYEAAEEKLITARGCISEAHKVQTSLIQKEAAGEKQPISLLMIHAQDHLMNAMTVVDMATEFIHLYKNQRG